MLDHSIRDPHPFSYHLGFMVKLARRGRPTWYRARRSRVQAPTTQIPLRVIIPAYRSPYGGARIAQTSGDRALVDTQ
jgi:hypothetical protein